MGILQALVLRPHVATWFWWAVAMPPLWALGWVVTTAAGIKVDQQFTNFGASGAIVFTVLSGLLLVQLLRPHARLLRWRCRRPRRPDDAGARHRAAPDRHAGGFNLFFFLLGRRFDYPNILRQPTGRSCAASLVARR